jgi:hypothetical protein
MTSLDRFELADRFSSRQAVQDARAAFLAGEIEADEMERRMDEAQVRVLYGEEMDRIPSNDLRLQATLERAVELDIERGVQQRQQQRHEAAARRPKLLKGA